MTDQPKELQYFEAGTTADGTRMVLSLVGTNEERSTFHVAPRYLPNLFMAIAMASEAMTNLPNDGMIIASKEAWAKLGFSSVDVTLQWNAERQALIVVLGRVGFEVPMDTDTARLIGEGLLGSVGGAPQSPRTGPMH